ncbi:phosphopantetheine-binding protein [Paracoccus cavernae]|uniref:phosphopantetheine-binding protein n=1 Tax=Paracoccus cavernae TaxID=1571207 RepID=UPI003630BFA5
MRIEDWIIGGHRTASGQALMPGTGWIELITEAAVEVGLSLPVAISDLEFLRPVLVADGGSALVTIRLEPEGDGLRVSVLDDPQAGPNVTARIETVQKDQPRGVVAPAVWQKDGQGAAIRSAQDSQMRFGQRWQVLRRYAITGGEGMAELALDPAFAGDLAQGYILHPALLDIATGWAMELVEGWRPDHLWVPMGYGSIIVHGPMGGQVISRIRNAGANTAAVGMAQFDIDLALPDGTVAVEIRGFAIRKLEGGFNAGSRAKVDAARPLSPAERRLHLNISQGIPAEIGPEMLTRALATGLPQVFVSSLDLPSLIAEAALPEDAGASEGGFERPDLDGDFVEPAPGLEAEIAAIWSELLGIAQIGAEDSFFDLGGHSLIAVRMFAQVRKAIGIDLPISTLFEAPTIAKLAALIAPRVAPRDGVVAAGPRLVAAADQGDKPARRFVVDMGGTDGGTPFFMVAGMFGNIMNLRQLAQRVGPDRHFYGLQARGLFGDDKPHESFIDAARDYLVEIRQVQPHGPYLLGGFSGGG